MKVLRALLVVSVVGLIAASCNPLAPGSPAGLIKTANGGSDWQGANKVKDNANATMSGLSISSLAFDPVKPERIFAGSYNDGVFLSEDGGESWRRILSKFIVYDLAVNPQSADIIYAAGTFDDHGRVLLTKDGGKSWNEVFNEASTGNPVRSIALNPNNPQEVVIGMEGGAIIKSDDEGTNWRLLQTYNSRVNRLRWKHNYLHAIVRNSGLYRSGDGGNSFVNLTASLTPSSNMAEVLISSAGIANFNQVAVSDSTADIMYVTTSNGLYKTFNGGSSWTFAAMPLKQQDVQTLAVTLAPNSDNIVYASAGSNIYRSNDSGITWQTQDTHSIGLINTILVHPQLPQIAYAGIYGL